MSQLINPESRLQKYADLTVDSVDESSVLMIEALWRNESCFVWALIVRDWGTFTPNVSAWIAHLHSSPARPPQTKRLRTRRHQDTKLMMSSTHCHISTVFIFKGSKLKYGLDMLGIWIMKHMNDIALRNMNWGNPPNLITIFVTLPQLKYLQL